MKVKWYKAVRTVEDIKSLREVATLVAYTYCFFPKENAVDLHRMGTITGKSPRHSGENLQTM